MNNIAVNRCEVIIDLNRSLLALPAASIFILMSSTCTTFYINLSKYFFVKILMKYVKFLSNSKAIYFALQKITPIMFVHYVIYLSNILSYIYNCRYLTKK